jgi:hypothetical protein
VLQSVPPSSTFIVPKINCFIPSKLHPAGGVNVDCGMHAILTMF